MLSVMIDGCILELCVGHISVASSGICIAPQKYTQFNFTKRLYIMIHFLTRTSHVLARIFSIQIICSLPGNRQLQLSSPGRFRALLHPRRPQFCFGGRLQADLRGFPARRLCHQGGNDRNKDVLHPGRIVDIVTKGGEVATSLSDGLTSEVTRLIWTDFYKHIYGLHTV